jgi:hypothetical protein
MNELGLLALCHLKICFPTAAINPPPAISIYPGAIDNEVGVQSKLGHARFRDLPIATEACEWLKRQ